jgi:inosine-uridine nucleoside N-ribohydrolase
MIDPEASKIALTADFPNITIAGNVANQVFPTKEFMEEVHSVPNPYSKLFYKYYDLSFPFWDETAAALMVDPSLSVNQTSGKSMWNMHLNCSGMRLTISSVPGRGYIIW